MNTSHIMEKMIAYSEGNLHDIAHFMKVYGFARTIGIQEGIDDKTQQILETAAIVHDIACPLCRRKYGNTDGKYQEKEGLILAREFLESMGDVPVDVIDRVAFLAGHHHTCADVDGADYQILLEADFLVNADESHLSHDAVRDFGNNVFRTKCGKRLLDDIYEI